MDNNYALEEICFRYLSGVMIIRDTNDLKKVFCDQDSKEVIIHSSVVLGCGPLYFTFLLEKRKEIKKQKNLPIRLWLDCGNRSGDTLRFLEINYPFLCTSVSNSVFLKLKSIANKKNVCLIHFPSTLFLR